MLTPTTLLLAGWIAASSGMALLRPLHRRLANAGIVDLGWTLLFRVTGIPATEAQAVQSRGDDYREYQKTTSVFVPWVPRS